MSRGRLVRATVLDKRRGSRPGFCNTVCSYRLSPFAPANIALYRRMGSTGWQASKQASAPGAAHTQAQKREASYLRVLCHVVEVDLEHCVLLTEALDVVRYFIDPGEEGAKTILNLSHVPLMLRNGIRSGITDAIDRFPSLYDALLLERRRQRVPIAIPILIAILNRTRTRAFVPAFVERQRG